jgi:SNF2 family DNA or RNA helicase
MSEIWKPKDFQDEGRCFLFDHKAAALWWRMGRGKTVTTASAFADLLDIGLSGKILVVAPKRVAKQTWPNEFKKWDHLSGMRWSTIIGTAKQRKEAANRNADVYFTNWENIAWLLDEYKIGWKWDTVVLDEASKVKSQSTRNYKTVKHLRMHKMVDRLYELTGSPAPNGLKDVWAPVYLMDRGRRLGRTQDAYLNRFFFRDRSGDLQIRGLPAQEHINDRLKDIVYALRSAVTDDEPIINPVEIELPSVVMEKYRQLETTTFLEIEGKQVTAAQASAMSGKLLQFASGGVYTEHPEWVEVHQEKIHALQDIIEESEGDPVIVAYGSRHERERILAAFPQAVAIDDAGDTLEEDWNAKRIPILVMHPGSGGHGLNLQFGGATIVWFSLTWNLEFFEQTISRLHGRHGQERDVIVHLLIAKDTLDEEVKLRLEGKASVQEALMIAQERRRRRR